MSVADNTHNLDMQTGPKTNRLEDWATRQANKIAIIEGQGQITYGEWNHLADKLAHSLSARGIGANDIVVARLQNRIEWALLSAALAKLDSAMLGLNWRLTASEVRYILDNSGASAFVCDDADPSHLRAAFSDLPLKLVACVSDDAGRNDLGFTPFAELLNSTSTTPLFSQRDARLIIYTSGTTGFPKGVVTAGAAAADNQELREYQESVRGEPPCAQEVVLVTMPMHHAAGPAIVRTGLARGSTMIFVRRFEPELVLQLIAQYKVTTWNGVPTMYKRLAALPASALKRYDVSSIRALSVGAAPVPYALKEWILDYFGECLREGYGSTELGMVTSLAPDMQRKKPGSSGRPFKHVHISIRDKNGAELAIGAVGEIWVKTPNAIQNYLNSDKLGRDTVDEHGYFRMGDVGRLDEEGYLYITDRTKDMIISGGVNIYPAEIEAALIQHPSIQDVAVIGIPDDEFGEQVKAFCELKPGAHLNPEDIFEFAKSKLASYKRPKSIDIVAELPRNTMGKLLKRDLRDPYWQDKERQV